MGEWIKRLLAKKREIGPNDKFKCPKCGGHYFTTHQDEPFRSTPLDECIGECLDEFKTDCKFAWIRKDDYLYFTPGPTGRGSQF